MSEPLAESAVEPEPVEPAEPVEPSEPAEPVEPAATSTAIDWDDPAIAERFAGMSRQQSLDLLAELGLVTYDQPAPVGPAAPDPLSDNYAQELEAWYEAKQAQANAPFAEYVATQQAAAVDAQIGNTIDQALTELNVPKPEDPAQAEAFTGVVRSIAESFAGVAAQKHGATPAAAQAAVKMAVEWIAADRKSSSDAGVEAYKESLKNPVSGSTPYEPGIRGAGVPAEGGAASEMDVARQFRSRVPA